MQNSHHSGLKKIADKYRGQWTDDNKQRANSGYVVISEGKAVGWKSTVSEPQTLLIGISGDVWQALGGNEQDGATEWAKLV